MNIPPNIHSVWNKRLYGAPSSLSLVNNERGQQQQQGKGQDKDNHADTSSVTLQSHSPSPSYQTIGDAKSKTETETPRTPTRKSSPSPLQFPTFHHDESSSSISSNDTLTDFPLVPPSLISSFSSSSSSFSSNPSTSKSRRRIIPTHISSSHTSSPPRVSPLSLHKLLISEFFGRKKEAEEMVQIAVKWGGKYVEKIIQSEIFKGKCQRERNQRKGKGNEKKSNEKCDFLCDSEVSSLLRTLRDSSLHHVLSILSSLYGPSLSLSPSYLSSSSASSSSLVSHEDDEWIMQCSLIAEDQIHRSTEIKIRDKIEEIWREMESEEREKEKEEGQIGYKKKLGIPPNGPVKISKVKIKNKNSSVFPLISNGDEMTISMGQQAIGAQNHFPKSLLTLISHVESNLLSSSSSSSSPYFSLFLCISLFIDQLDPLRVERIEDITRGDKGRDIIKRIIKIHTKEEDKGKGTGKETTVEGTITGTGTREKETKEDQMDRMKVNDSSSVSPSPLLSSLSSLLSPSDFSLWNGEMSRRFVFCLFKGTFQMVEKDKQKANPFEFFYHLSYSWILILITHKHNKTFTLSTTTTTTSPSFPMFTVDWEMLCVRLLSDKVIEIKKYPTRCPLPFSPPSFLSPLLLLSPWFFPLLSLLFVYFHFISLYHTHCDFFHSNELSHLLLALCKVKQEHFEEKAEEYDGIREQLMRRVSMQIESVDNADADFDLESSRVLLSMMDYVDVSVLNLLSLIAQPV